MKRCLAAMVTFLSLASIAAGVTGTSGDWSFTIVDYGLDTAYARIDGVVGTAYRETLTVPESVTYSSIPYHVRAVGSSAGRDLSCGMLIVPASAMELGGCFKGAKITGTLKVTKSSDGNYYPVPEQMFQEVNMRRVELDGVAALPSDFYTDGAFRFCTNLVSVVLGEGLREIGERTFWDCTALASVAIPDTVTNIAWQAFLNCTSLASVRFGSGLGTIGEAAFENCSALGSIEIPDGVTNVAGRAFSSCSSVTNIVIGSGLSPVPADVFPLDAPVDTLTVNGSGETVVAEQAFADSKIRHLVLNGVASLPCDFYTQGAFRFCTNLVSVVLGEGLLEIGESTFGNCTALASVSIPDTVTNIAWQAFLNCTSLASVRFGSGLRTICGQAFQNCSALGSIEIPDSVTNVADKAFWYCSSVTNIVIGSGLSPVSAGVFPLDAPVDTLTVNGSGETVIAEEAFADSKIRHLVLNGVALLPCDYYTQGAFRACENLVSVVFGEGLREIGERTFWNCTSLTSVVLPSSLTTLGPNAFLGCTRLSSLVFPGKPPAGLADAGLHEGMTLIYRADSAGDWTEVKIPGVEIVMEPEEGKTWTADTTRPWASCGDVYAHKGTLARSEVWAADKTHVVYGWVTVPEGMTLTIEPGAVVKFCTGMGIYVKGGASCIARGVVFTHVSDDEVGGDSDADDGANKPIAGAYAFYGQVTDDVDTRYRCRIIQTSGTLGVDGDWDGDGTVYCVDGDLTVNAKLVIRPGAIVKVAAGKKLSVGSGGKLLALGTRMKPVVFTSWRDDEFGGDTDGDGGANPPAGGDWDGIWVNGQAELAYVVAMYAGAGNERGIVQTQNSGSLSLTGCTIAHAQYDGVWNWGGNIAATNCVITDCGLGWAPYRGSLNEIVNCVFYDCSHILMYWSYWSGMPRFINCIFSEITTKWTDTKEDAQFRDGCTFENCCFWNGPSSSGPQTCDKAGSDGNGFADPLLIDPANGDFRIAYNSPCVDAAKGAVAPARDYYGQTRQNVYEDVSGTPDAEGKYPDIGIYEVMPRDVDADVDLAVVSVVAPAATEVGDTIDVSWCVANVGVGAASGARRDRVELVGANGATVQLGTVEVDSAIAARGQKDYNGTFRVPASVEGDARIRVTANSERDVFEGTAYGNNSGESSALAVSVPTLTIPADGASLSLDAGASAGYVVGAAFPEGGLLLVRASGAGDLSALRAYSGAGRMPTADTRFAAAMALADGSLLLAVPSGGDARVGFENATGEAVEVTVRAIPGAFVLYDTGIERVSASGATSLTFYGNGFAEGLTAALVGGSGRVEASKVLVHGGNEACATFDTSSLSPGTYALEVACAGERASVPRLEVVTAGRGPEWGCAINMPATVRMGRVYTATFSYSNKGDAEMDAPYVVLAAGDDTSIRLSDQEPWDTEIHLLAVSGSYPASRLKPGERREVTVQYMTTGQRAAIDAVVTHESSDPYPWTNDEIFLRPPQMNDEVWGHLFASLKVLYGDTWNSWLARLRKKADEKHAATGTQLKVFEYGDAMLADVRAILAVDPVVPTLGSCTDMRGRFIEVVRSYSTGLASRLSKGLFGYGWHSPFETRLIYDATPEDSLRVDFDIQGVTLLSFMRQSPQSAWQVMPAREKAMLSFAGGVWTYSEKSGASLTFRADGRIASRVTADGRTTAFTYSGDRLTSVTHGQGERLDFEYDEASGCVKTVRDGTGRTATYAYDDGMLVSVVGADGLTLKYAYNPAGSTKASRALIRQTEPTGVTRDITWNDAGLIVSTAVNGSKFVNEIIRDDDGSVTVTGANGVTGRLRYGPSGELLQVTDGAGQTTKTEYDQDGRPVGIVTPGGKRMAMGYTAEGRNTSVTLPSGAVRQQTWNDASDEIASVVGPGGEARRFEFDAKGRITGENLPNGAYRSAAYNAEGSVTRVVSAVGEDIGFGYDAFGQITNVVSESTGRTCSFAYDARGHIERAADSLTGSTLFTYGSQGQLLTFTSGERGYTMTYDSLYRPETKTSAAGFTEKRVYDAFGRLWKVLDGSDSVLVENVYDDVTGNLAQRKYGNGTSEAYTFDTQGRLVQISVRRGGTELEKLAYVYNADGKCIRMETSAGTNDYDYDLDGQLVHADYDDGTSEDFAYDANGVRADLPEGVTFDDEGRLVEQGGAAGRMKCAYDAFGRLCGVTNAASGIAWSCAYDAFGNRVRVNENGRVTERVYLPGTNKLLDEYEDGVCVRHHVWVGDCRVAVVGTGGIRYLHADLLGSVRLVTDGSGAETGRAAFRAFGEKRGATGADANLCGWVAAFGVETDASGLHYMRHRYYSAELRSFISEDPLGIRSGETNLRRYCFNDPIMNIDPLGLKVTKCDWLRWGNRALTVIGGGLAIAGLVSTAPALAVGGAVVGATSIGLSFWREKSCGDEYTTADKVKDVLSLGLGVSGFFKAVDTTSKVYKVSTAIDGVRSGYDGATETPNIVRDARNLSAGTIMQNSRWGNFKTDEELLDSL